MKQNKKAQDKGFTLIFTLLLVTIMLGIIIVTVSSTQSILTGNHQDRKALQAQYAANTVMECMQHFASLGVFDTWESMQTYDCFSNVQGAHGTFQAGLATPTLPGACISHDYNYALTLADNSSVKVTVNVIPTEESVIIPAGGGGTTTISSTLCKVHLVVAGHNESTSHSASSAEHTQEAIFPAPITSALVTYLASN